MALASTSEYSTDAALRAEYSRLVNAGGIHILPVDIVDQIRRDKPVLDREPFGQGRHYGLYMDSKSLRLEVSGAYPGSELWFSWEILALGEFLNLDVDQFSLRQARDVALSEAAISYAIWRDTEEGIAEHKDWLAMRAATQNQESAWRDMPSIAGDKAAQPPWIKAAREDLESTSAFFAIEFASRLYPRLVGSVSYDDQLAAIRQAFIETVEAA